jgi:uncharacterized protein YfaS (alpha-2-macroglobulin family)
VADAELAIVVVDEAVLALTGYQLADPLATFYAARGADTSSFYGRSSMILANPDLLGAQSGMGDGDMLMRESAAYATAAPAMAGDAMMLAMPAAAPMAEEAAMEASSAPGWQTAGAPIAVRADFNPLALFAPAERTDADGQVYVTYKLPDNLTRYRLMVVAATDAQFGSAESNLTARLPLMVRPSAPRFLNFGDRFELPVVIQNQTDAALTVDVVAESANLKLDGGQGQRVDRAGQRPRRGALPRYDRECGQARVQFGAVAGDYADAATVELARLHAGDDRSLCHLRRDRRRRHRPAGGAAAGCLPAVWRAGAEHLVHGASDAHRRLALPASLSV